MSLVAYDCITSTNSRIGTTLAALCTLSVADFQAINRYVLETIEDKHIVTPKV